VLLPSGEGPLPGVMLKFIFAPSGITVSLVVAPLEALRSRFKKEVATNAGMESPRAPIASAMRVLRTEVRWRMMIMATLWPS
jgi:hypothetical protein